jgi:peptidoglycan/LPS O-acetylase OafA/YrhL
MAVRSGGVAIAPSSLYIPSLDGMRALAFLVVFVAHSMPFNVLPGGFGVTVFFFLSGYLITTLLRGEAHKTGTISLKSFYRRRVLRIFPPCYLTIIIVGVLAAAGVLYNAESYKSLVSGFLYFSNYWNILGWGNLPAGLGVLWSLAIEEHYYLIYPLLYAWFVRKSIRRRHQAVILLGLCALTLAWRCYRAFVVHSSWENIYEGTDTRFDAILFGCALAIMANPRFGDRIDWLKKYAKQLAVGGVFLIALTFVCRNLMFRETIRYTLQSVALMPIFFLIASPQRNLVIRFLESSVLRHLGCLSYSMYLIHHTLFHAFYHYYRPGILIASVVFVLTLAYAQLMRTFVELPIQRARSRAEKRGAVVVAIDSLQPREVVEAVAK